VTAITTATPTEAAHVSDSAGGVDRAIRISTVIAVLVAAGVAAYEWHWHAYAVIQAHGESGVTARLEPARHPGERAQRIEVKVDVRVVQGIRSHGYQDDAAACARR
jgi:hypothetical protein